ncbi:MAG: acyl carrier protein [Actinocatenispora sp.]
MTEVDPVFTTVSEIIAKVAKIPLEQVKAENSVTGLTNVDSIVLLEIVATTEIALNIEIDEEELFKIDTVGDFVAVCRQLTPAQI